VEGAVGLAVGDLLEVVDAEQLDIGLIEPPVGDR
jgi:hypothetical protein